MANNLGVEVILREHGVSVDSAALHALLADAEQARQFEDWIVANVRNETVLSQDELAL